jgi:hypothetical protein
VGMTSEYFRIFIVSSISSPQGPQKFQPAAPGCASTF